MPIKNENIVFYVARLIIFVRVVKERDLNRLKNKYQYIKDCEVGAGRTQYFAACLKGLIGALDNPFWKQAEAL